MHARQRAGSIGVILAVAASVLSGIASPAAATTVSVSARIAPFVAASPSDSSVTIRSNVPWSLVVESEHDGIVSTAYVEGERTGADPVLIEVEGKVIGFTLEMDPTQD